MSRRLPIGAVLIALAVTACGGGGGDGDGASASTEINVTGTEFQFSPDAWVVASGSELALTYDNAGAIEHNLLILSSPIELESDLTEDLILFETSAPAGGVATESIPPLQPGDYQVVCNIEGHFASGMEGLLTVSG